MRTYPPSLSVSRISASAAKSYPAKRVPSLLTVPVKLRLERLFTVVPLLFTVTVTRRPVEKALPSW